MLISVIITSHNYEKYLPTAIDSVLIQEDVQKEILIVDDGSSDNSAIIAQKYAAMHSSIRCFCKPQGGQASAFNVGYMAAKGDVIAFLDADDYWFPGKLKAIALLHSSWGMIRHNLLKNNEVPYALLKPGDGQREKLFRYGYAGVMPTSALSVSKWVAERIFPIPERGLELCADFYLKCAAMLHTDVWTLNECLGCYRVHGKNAWYANSRRVLPTIAFDLINQQLAATSRTRIPFSENSLPDALISTIKLKNGQPYVIYGAGGAGRRFYQKLQEANAQCIGFVDSDPSKWDTTVVDDLMVHPPHRLNSLVKDNVKILIASMYNAEILRDLEKLGFSEDNHVVASRL